MSTSLSERVNGHTWTMALPGREFPARGKKVTLRARTHSGCADNQHPTGESTLMKSHSGFHLLKFPHALARRALASALSYGREGAMDGKAEHDHKLLNRTNLHLGNDRLEMFLVF
jgi:hypothetical protein